MKITNTKNKKTCYATVVDSCPGCGSNDLGMLKTIISNPDPFSQGFYADVSPGVFKAIAKLDDGVAPISWEVSRLGDLFHSILMKLSHYSWLDYAVFGLFVARDCSPSTSGFPLYLRRLSSHYFLYHFLTV